MVGGQFCIWAFVQCCSAAVHHACNSNAVYCKRNQNVDVCKALGW